MMESGAFLRRLACTAFVFVAGIFFVAVSPGPRRAAAQESPPSAGPSPAATSSPPAGTSVTTPAPEQPQPPAPAPSPPELVGAPATPRTFDFMDTRLNFTCTHEDLFRDPTVLPAAPGFRCGRPGALGILFFDNYDTRFSGFETLSHLALYSHVEKSHIDAEAGFIVRINELAEDNIRLADGGSYVRVAWWFDPAHVKKTRLAFVGFPVSSDRMRLGYSYRISWGGSPEFFKPNPDVPGSTGRNTDSVPGAKLQLDTENAYAYVGLKSSLLLDPEINEKRSVLAYLLGAGWDVSPILRIEANGGVFDRGKNEKEDVLSERVTLYGASVQVALHDGMPVGSSIDYALYRNEPATIARLFRREAYPGGVAWLVAAEATRLFQVLKDPEATGATTVQEALAGDVNVRLKIDYTRLKLDVMYRDLAYILHTTPSLPAYEDFPAAFETTPELFAAIGADHHFPSLGLTVGATFGVDLPATLKTPTATAIPGNLTTSTTAVVRNESFIQVLPEGEDVAVIWATKTSARVDFADRFAALADVYFQYDPNTVRFDRESPEGTFNRATFANFEQLGFNLTLEARF